MSRAPTPLSMHEPSGWVLLPLALLAYGCALLFLVLALLGVLSTIDAATSDATIPIALHAQATLAATPGWHSYSGGAFIADGSAVTATTVSTDVSGADTLTRVAIRLGPTLWSVTIVMVGSALGLTFARLRARDPGRLASRSVLVGAIGLAVGSSIAQLVAAWADMRLGHVAWIGEHGATGFTAIGKDVFDFTPLAVAAVLLGAVVVVRRSESAPADA